MFIMKNSTLRPRFLMWLLTNSVSETLLFGVLKLSYISFIKYIFHISLIWFLSGKFLFRILKLLHYSLCIVYIILTFKSLPFFYISKDGKCNLYIFRLCEISFYPINFNMLPHQINWAHIYAIRYIL